MNERIDFFKLKREIDARDREYQGMFKDLVVADSAVLPAQEEPKMTRKKRFNSAVIEESVVKPKAFE